MNYKFPVTWWPKTRKPYSFTVLEAGKLKFRSEQSCVPSKALKKIAPVFLPASGGCSVAQSCLTLCDPVDCSIPGFPVHSHLLEFVQIHVHWVNDAIQLPHPLGRPLLLLPSIFPSIRVFSNESVLHIRWAKCWSFSFSLSPFSGYSGLISFRKDHFFQLLAAAGVVGLWLHHFNHCLPVHIAFSS